MNKSKVKKWQTPILVSTLPKMGRSIQSMGITNVKEPGKRVL